MSWRYELASGESYFRQGDLGRALKKFLAVEKHYADITEDQFDFHSYCLRKMTLRTYVEMLKFQDRLHSHAYFHKAAAGTIRWSIWHRVQIILLIKMIHCWILVINVVCICTLFCSIKYSLMDFHGLKGCFFGVKYCDLSLQVLCMMVMPEISLKWEFKLLEKKIILYPDLTKFS